MMTAVILAAGMASRLRPLTDHCPKCLLKVGGKTLLQRTVDNIIANGINRLAVVTGYRAEMIEGFLKDNYPQLDITFIHNADYQTTNNIYSLWLSRPQVDGKPFLLLDSDILFDGKIITSLMQEQGPALALNNHPLGNEEIKVIVNSQCMVMEISKVCSISRAIGESVGIEKIDAGYSAALFRELEVMIKKEGLDNVFYERAFERLIPQGFTFKAVDITHLQSMELDTVQDFEKAASLDISF